MTTTRNRPPGRPSAGAARASATRRSPLVLVAVVAVVVLGAVVIALSLGGDDGGSLRDQAGPGVAGTRAAAEVSVEGTALPALPDAGDDPAVGAVAPVLSGTSPGGDAVTTAPDGSPTVVAVVAHWCPFCAVEVPRLVEMVSNGDLPEGTRLVALATANDERAPRFPPGEWLADEGWQGQALLDDGAATGAQAMGTTGYPFLVVLDGEGRVVQRLSGEQPEGAIQAAVEAAASPS